MELVTAALRVVVRFFLLIYKRFGINGILTLVLLAEIPAVCVYYNINSQNYLLDREYEMTTSAEDSIYNGVEMVKRVEPETVIDGLSNDTVYQNREYFLVRLGIRNEYSQEMTYFAGLGAKDQDGNILDCQRYDYYRTSNQGRVVVPGGADTLVSYVLVLTQEEAEHTTEITFTDFMDEENTFTIDFTGFADGEDDVVIDVSKKK